MQYTRREIGKLALGVPAAALLPSALLAQAKPNSKWGGVQVGIIAPYAFQGTATTAEEILKSMLRLGISAVELQNDPVERFAGAPLPAGRGGGRGTGGSGAAGAAGGPGAAGAGAAGGPGGRQGGGRAPLTPEQQEAQRARAEELKKWRLAAPMEKYRDLRRMYNDAGVQIYAFKLALTDAMSDEEYDYTFNVAKSLGASHVTMEMPNKNAALTKRIGDVAAKHKIVVGYHQHTQATFTLWDEAVSQSKFNGINLDVGHYVAGTSESPVPLIKKYHDRITSIHLKDRKKDNGPNMPWGQGDTPLREILQLMKTEKYTFPATIELEYRVEGSDPMTELEKCVAFCREALAANTTRS